MRNVILYSENVSVADPCSAETETILLVEYEFAGGRGRPGADLSAQAVPRTPSHRYGIDQYPVRSTTNPALQASLGGSYMKLSKHLHLLTLCAAVAASSAWAIQGTVLYSIPDGTYKADLETGTTTKLFDWGGYARIVVSPDGRQVAACGLWQAGGGILVGNTDGTDDSILTHGSDYSGTAPNQYDINATSEATYNYGLGRNISFGPNGVYFIRCTGEWTGSGGQTSKMLCYADRVTGIVHEVVDISTVDDDHQAIFVSSDGRKALSWCHSRTVAIDVNATFDGGSHHLITDIWGHGPVINASGSVVISNAITGQCDVIDDHRTWVVYDWTNGGCGNYLDQYLSPIASPTGTGTQAVVRGSTASGEKGEDYITFGTDEGKAYLLHWSTGATEEIPAFGEVFLGVLPSSSDPTLSVSPSSVSFTASGSQDVTVTNVGAGTLGAVATSIAYASGSGWLTAAVQGSGGNSQTISNTVDVSGLAAGSHSATVTVSGGGASNTALYTVQVNLNVPGNLNAAVSGTRFRHVTLTWSDNSTGETGFSIERSFDGGAYSEVGTVGPDATSYVDSNVTCVNTAQYSYRVRASLSGGGYSGYSAAADVTVDCVDWIALTGPAGGTVYEPGDTVWIQWEANNVDQVYIEGSIDGGENMIQISVDGGVSPAMATWANYPWVPQLPQGMDSTTMALVKVSKYTDRGGIYDVSDEFTVHGAQSSALGKSAWRGAVAPGLHRGIVMSLARTNRITYSLNEGEQGLIKVFQANGALVHTIPCTEAGTHTVSWDGATGRGANAGRGLYLVRMVVR
ncbi:MAG: hypothetical protein GF331_08650 [Chitinivibrionales bacterium]|nr:hypothetical protein [Chitinivibrionales bacterium]